MTTQLFIGGEKIKTAKSQAVRNPFTGAETGRVALGDESTVDSAIATARTAFPKTRSVPAHERHPCLFFAPEEIPRLRERVEREPFRSWWATRRDSGDAVSSAFRWLLAGDEAAAAKARDALLHTPIGREAVHGYIEPSSHHFFVTVMTFAHTVDVKLPALTE